MPFFIIFAAFAVAGSASVAVDASKRAERESAARRRAEAAIAQTVGELSEALETKEARNRELEAALERQGSLSTALLAELEELRSEVASIRRRLGREVVTTGTSRWEGP